jgi:hypothetical protein
VDIPLPWERLLWRGHPAFQIPGRERYVLTDVRLVRLTRTEADEILVRDIGDILCDESRLDPFIGSTVIVRSRDRRRAAIVLRRVRRGPQLAALIEWLSGEPDERRSKLDADALDAAMAWDPRRISRGLAQALAGLAAALALVFGVAIGLHGTAPSPASYAADDPIYPAGQKRPTDDIVQYMERDVMPWARATLGPIKGGSDRVTCETCHGQHADLRGWSMPAVAALPQPDVKEQGWEHYGGPMDAQMRNAIYGYLAESDKQVKAGYMREVVMPGMARLLHRPAYDFTRPYEYNRSRLAFGCYHCHRVS